MSNDFELPSDPDPVKATDKTPDEKKDGPGSPETPEYSKQELLRVFDEILFSGEYREDYKIRNRLVVTFRTRTAEEINSIQKAVDSAGLNLISSVESLKTLKYLETSLAVYDGKDLRLMKPEDRTKLVSGLPSPIVGILMNLMMKFDDKVAKACKEGELNF